MVTIPFAEYLENAVLLDRTAAKFEQSAGGASWR
jgi:hypothetical protein